MLPGEADAAMQLQTVVDDEVLALTCGGLCHRHGLRAARVVLGDRECGVPADRGRAFHGEVHIGHAMFQCLEGTDLPLVLNADLGVLDGPLEDLPTGRDRHHRERDRCLVEGAAKTRLHVGTRCSDDVIAAHRHVLEYEIGHRHRGIDNRPRLDPYLLRSDEEGSQPVRRPPCHQDVVRRGPVLDRLFAPGQPPAGPGRDDRQASSKIAGTPTARFGDSEGTGPPAGGDVRQQPLPCRGVGELADGRRELGRRRQERAGDGRATQLLGDDGQLEEAHADAAVLGVDREPRPVQTDHLPPHLGGVTAALIDSSHDRGRRDAVDDVARRCPAAPPAPGRTRDPRTPPLRERHSLL